MVRQDVVSYFQEGIRRGFSPERLKAELLQNNFSYLDVDTAYQMFAEKPIGVITSTENKKRRFSKVEIYLGAALIILFVLLVFLIVKKDAIISFFS